jgi:hypothetical protein
MSAPISAGADAATTRVPAGGDLQAAIDAARPGDTILLDPGVEYVGNFRLPVHGGSSYITIRSAASDSVLPPAGTRISPAYAAHLPKLRSDNVSPAIATRPGAAFWRLQFLELRANRRGFYDIVTLGDGSLAQDSLDDLPHDLIIDRVYMQGDPLHGQKRGIALNSGRTTIINSHIAGIRAIGQDSIAVGGWNGPGPYHIENNYLEAAGEVVLFGGATPGIHGVIPSDIVVRSNTITRPLSWRNPVIPAPAGVHGTGGAAGSLPAGTYAYRVVARRPAYDTEAGSPPSNEVTVAVGVNGSVALSWSPVPDATEYRVYGRAPGAPSGYWTVTTTSFTDTGAGVEAGGKPGSGTTWQVKNLLELKNARRVHIAHNVMENNWAEAQSGVAILFTPRAENGACEWCVVEDVTFEYNIMRRIGAGFTLLGIDNYSPSQQLNNIRIRHNEISDMGAAWGGNGYFVMMTGNPRDIIVDHNTIVAVGGGGLVQLDGPPIRGFVFTNNVARHNSYGIIGTSTAPGTDSIRAFLPDAVITRNVMAGGSASEYPAGNLFPSIRDFESHFVDYARGVYSLKPGTDWAGAGTDGLDLGAIFERPDRTTTGLTAPRNPRLIR